MTSRVLGRGLVRAGLIVLLSSPGVHAGSLRDSGEGLETSAIDVRIPEPPEYAAVGSEPADSPAAADDPQPSETDFAFAHVNVISMVDGRILEDYTVIIRGERIVEMGPANQISIGEGATIVAAEGQYLIPGLADMHVHLWPEGDLVLYVANGVTTIRSLFGDSAHLEWREQIKRHERLGPTIYTSGPIVDGEPPYWPGSTVVSSPGEAEAVVLEQKRAGYNAIKVYANLLPEDYDAILGAAKKHQMPVYGHVPIRLSLRDVLTRGQRSFEHMMDFVYALSYADERSRADLIEASAGRVKNKNTAFFVTPYENADQSHIPDLAADVAASGAWVCPTLVAARKAAHDSTEFETWWADPFMAYVAPEVRGYWKMQDERLRAEGVDLAAMKRGVGLEFRCAAALHDAGAKLLLGTDTPNPFVIPGFSVHEELQNYVDFGMTPHEALKTATVAAAEFMEAPAEFGSIAPGMRADLLLLTRNPLEDISATRNRVGVMVRGRWYLQSALTNSLAALAARYAAAPAKVEESEQ